MKSLVYALQFCLIGASLYAQTPHLITIAELKQLANCSDQTCLGSELNQWNFTYKTTKKGKSNGLEGTQYQYTRPHRNRAFTESTASYWVMSDNSRRVMLTSDNKTWIAGLKTDIQQNGFTFIDQKGAFGEEHYVLEGGNLVWHLNWRKPGLLVDLEPHSITVHKTTNAAIQPASPTVVQSISPVTTQPQVDDSPHLGGDWDTKYPSMNVVDVLKAERQYTADYEKKHGKVGQTFSRVEKMRIQAKRTGQYRPLTDKRWSDAFDLPIRTMGFSAFANDRTRLYRQEALFDVGGEQIWMPIQELLIKTLEKEAAVGQPVTLYAVLVSHHDFGGTLHLSFLVNEFAAATSVAYQSSTTTIKPPTTTGQLLPQGSTLLFKNVKSKLTSAEKVAIFQAMKFEPVESNDAFITESCHDNPFNATVAINDLNKDGIDEIQIIWGNLCTSGATASSTALFVKDKSGIYQKTLNIEACGYSILKTSNLGFPDLLLCSRGFDPPIWRWNDTAYQFHKKQTSTVSANIESRTPGSQKFVGGKTPEELCTALLKALKTKNKDLWMRCMHPSDIESDELSAKRFDQYRECLDEKGITDWASVTYSRMTHLARPNGGSKVDLETVRSRVSLEFTYKNQEFVGQIQFASFDEYEGKWLVRYGEGGGYMCNVMRSMR